MIILYSILAVYLFLVVCWLFYVAIMNLARVRKQLGFVAKVFAYPILAVGFALNFILTTTIGTILFLDFPRWPNDVGLTARLHRYVEDPNAAKWRQKLAHWICTNLLDALDPTGDHC
ncbi:hypothetical protein [Microcystis sp. M42BS1]|uniref:hypothetical protein n=1 Tax=Microcystis sp. M42BS1 TaxID=2771192 RepID=UPI0025870A8B|nr:hypothetical protein [Microcystis sp. M42BS1]MCA2570708.1 hypothetical protein [Microcystis sp. M42BS1]